MPDSVLITGASSGIGRALAIEFSRRGYALGLCARRLELLENLQHELNRNHTVEIAELDVSQYDDVKEVLLKLAEKLGWTIEGVERDRFRIDDSFVSETLLSQLYNEFRVMPELEP